MSPNQKKVVIGGGVIAGLLALAGSAALLRKPHGRRAGKGASENASGGDTAEAPAQAAAAADTTPGATAAMVPAGSPAAGLPDSPVTTLLSLAPARLIVEEPVLVERLRREAAHHGGRGR